MEHREKAHEKPHWVGFSSVKHFVWCLVNVIISQQGRLLWNQKTWCHMSLGGLIDVPGKRLDELTAILPISQAPLSGAHTRNTSVTNSLSLHCTLFKTRVALLGFLPSSTEKQQGPREMPTVYLLKRESHGAIWTSQPQEKAPLLGHQAPGDLLLVYFLLMTMWRGKSQSKGRKGGMQAASGQQWGRVKYLECGHPFP